MGEWEAWLKSRDGRLTGPISLSSPISGSRYRCGFSVRGPRHLPAMVFSNTIGEGSITAVENFFPARFRFSFRLIPKHLFLARGGAPLTRRGTRRFRTRPKCGRVSPFYKQPYFFLFLGIPPGTPGFINFPNAYPGASPVIHRAQCNPTPFPTKTGNLL